MRNKTGKEPCRQCGTCCKKGGPSLHKEDMVLLRQGSIVFAELITVRTGEKVLLPFSGKAEPASQELIKLAGQKGEWTCVHYDQENSSCQIYKDRPLECRLLDCRDTQALIDVIGRDTLERRNILNPEDPILELIAKHDMECPWERVDMLGDRLLQNRDGEILPELSAIVNKDLEFRRSAFNEYGMPGEIELFVFGRPIFLFLGQYGISVSEKNGELVLTY